MERVTGDAVRGVTGGRDESTARSTVSYKGGLGPASRKGTPRTSIHTLGSRMNLIINESAIISVPRSMRHERRKLRNLRSSLQPPSMEGPVQYSSQVAGCSSVQT